jgi:hypothetical protein
MKCIICKKEGLITVSLTDKKKGEMLGSINLCAKHEKMRVKHSKRYKKLLKKRI